MEFEGRGLSSGDGLREGVGVGGKDFEYVGFGGTKKGHILWRVSGVVGDLDLSGTRADRRGCENERNFAVLIWGVAVGFGASVDESEIGPVFADDFDVCDGEGNTVGRCGGVGEPDELLCRLSVERC